MCRNKTAQLTDIFQDDLHLITRYPPAAEAPSLQRSLAILHCLLIVLTVHVVSFSLLKMVSGMSEIN